MTLYLSMPRQSDRYDHTENKAWLRLWVCNSFSSLFFFCNAISRTDLNDITDCPSLCCSRNLKDTCTKKQLEVQVYIKQATIHTSTECETLNGERRLIVIFLSITSGVATWLTVTIILLIFLSPFLFSPFIYVLNFLCTKLRKRGLHLSEHLSISNVVFFFFIVLSAILGVYCG